LLHINKRHTYYIYKESIGTKMNDFNLSLEVVQGHVNHCVIFAIEYLRNIDRAIGSTGPSIGNGLLGIKLSCDWWRHVTLKAQTCDPQYA